MRLRPRYLNQCSRIQTTYLTDHVLVNSLKGTAVTEEAFKAIHSREFGGRIWRQNNLGFEL